MTERCLVQAAAYGSGAIGDGQTSPEARRSSEGDIEELEEAGERLPAATGNHRAAEVWLCPGDAKEGPESLLGLVVDGAD